MEFWDVLRSRHAVRDYLPDPVPNDALRRILEAAQLAPSAMNAQPWHFYVCAGDVRERLGKVIAQTTVHLTEYMDALGPDRYQEVVRWYSSLGDAPVLIVVGMDRPDDDFGRLNAYLSVGTAIENLLLAATNEGFGVNNVTFSFWVRDDIASTVSAQPEEEIVSVITLGYPSEVKPVAPAHELNHVTFLE